MESSTEPAATTTDDARAGAEHVLVFPQRTAAEQVAATLHEEGFAQVVVVRAASRTEGDDDAHAWAVRVTDDRLPGASGGGAYEGLRERFATLVTDHGGWYDEPGDPRPPVTAEDEATDGPTDPSSKDN